MSLHAQAQSEKWKEWETQADTLLNHQDFEGALNLYSKIVSKIRKEFKRIYPVFYKRAVCYYNLDHFDLAANDLEVFIPANPENLQALLLRALVYKEQGKTDQQIADLNHLILLQPRTQELLKWRASAFLEKENYPMAKKDLLAVKKIQDDPETEMYLGMTYYYQGQVDSALLSLNTAIARDVTFLPPYLYAGSFCLQEEKYALAIKYLDVALKLEPKNKNALFYKGVALVELKRVTEGCRCLTKAFEAGEDDAADYLKEHCYGMED